MKINIAEDFSATPGGRLIKEGKNSGEEFRNDILIPKYKKAKESNEILEINFDGTFGYSPSFLDEAFGGLVRIQKEKGIFSKIKIISNDNVGIERKIRKYMEEAEKQI